MFLLNLLTYNDSRSKSKCLSKWINIQFEWNSEILKTASDVHFFTLLSGSFNKLIILGKAYWTNGAKVYSYGPSSIAL